MSQPEAPDVLRRAQRWIAVALAASAVLYVGYGVYSGWHETSEALQRFTWWLAVPILLTTLGNYGLRYAKWDYLLRRMGVRVQHRDNLQIYAIGLLMTLSPAKVGEIVKPYLVRRVAGTSMRRTLPVLAAERATDAIAVLLLAAIGVGTYASEQTGVVLLSLATVLGGLAILFVAPLAELVFRTAERVRPLAGLVGQARELYTTLRSCLSPVPLLYTLGLSVVAWWLECVGMWLVLQGFGLEVDLGAATFIYAFATGIGAVSPGGVGVADAGLIEGIHRLIPGTPAGVATAAALIVRVATLWFGVLLGAIALSRVDRLSETPAEEEPALP